MKITFLCSTFVSIALSLLVNHTAIAEPYGKVNYILSVADVFEKSPETFARSIGVFYFNKDTGLLLSDPHNDKGYHERAVFTCKTPNIEVRSFKSVRYYLDVVQLPTYPILWFRLAIEDGMSPKFKNADNTSGAEFCEFAIDVNDPIFEKDVKALTTTADSLILLGNSGSSMVAREENGFLKVNDNRQKVARIRELLKTKYRGATENDRRTAILQLKHNYPITVDLDE